VIDTCEPGGDELGTFNISSLAGSSSHPAAAMSAKHGNRAVELEERQRGFLQGDGIAD